MEKSTTTDQSRIVQQLSKPQTQLTSQQLANVQIVQKTIKRYQNKISQMLKIIHKQRKQNDTLKTQLKNLNENLNIMIQKINLKNQKKEEPQKQDTIKKSLQNQIKKNVVMKKQLDVLRAKVKMFEGQKITDLQDQIRQKDKVIQQQNNTIKMYEKINKQESNMDIYKKYSEAQDKINSLNNQLIHLNKKLTESKKQQQKQQKSIKRQHQQILSLQKKQPGKTSPLFTKRDQKLQNSLSSEALKLRQKLESLQNAKKMSDKAFRVQIDNLKTKNKILENQLEEYKSMVNRKDKEANILVSKMKQMSRKSHQTLEPVEKISLKAEEMTGSGLFDHRKQFKGLMHLQNNSNKYDDSQSLPLEKTYRIKSVKFVWFEEHILSLSTTYELSDNTVKEILSFSIPHQYKNTKQQVLSLNDYEYINELQIYCSRFIEFIRIKTSRNQLLQVGTEKNQAKCKKFLYDIKTNQKPIAFMGAIEIKKLGGNEFNVNNKQHLISLGIEIKKKNVFTKNKFHSPAGLRSQSLLKKVDKIHSRLGITKQFENDKNVKSFQQTQQK